MLENLVNLTNNILCFSDEILSFYCLSMVDTIKLGMKERCPLCNTPSSYFYKDVQQYCRCPECRAIFVIKEDLPKANEEIERYEMHDVDTADKGYRKFVSPITKSVMKDFSTTEKGLDFGAGRSAIISVVLAENGYEIKNYDPYFHNLPQYLQEKYDYITSCEVIEHLYNPAKEFARLRSMLKESSKLYLMTDIYDESIDFATWYYKNDPTHVFLYTKETFFWIAKKYGFKDVLIEKRLITLSI